MSGPFRLSVSLIKLRQNADEKLLTSSYQRTLSPIYKSPMSRSSSGIPDETRFFLALVTDILLNIFLLPMERSGKKSKTRALILLKREDYHHKPVLNLANRLTLINAFPTLFQITCKFWRPPRPSGWGGCQPNKSVIVHPRMFITVWLKLIMRYLFMLHTYHETNNVFKWSYR